MYPAKPTEFLTLPHRRMSVTALLLAAVLGLSACSDSDSDIEPDDGPDGGGLPNDPDNAPTDVIDTPDSPPLPEIDPNDVVPDVVQVNIADSLLDRMEYSELIGLIQQADLTVALRDDNSGEGWTLFAPTNQAFEDYGLESLNLDQKNSLVKNLLHSGRLASIDLSAGTLAMTSGSLQIVRSDSGITVGGAVIVAQDREFSNGFIHFVNGVPQPD